MSFDSSNEYFLWQDLSMGTIIFYPLTFFLNIHLANYFWAVSARALIFHMSISNDKTFPRALRPWPLNWPSFLKNFNLVYNFWTVSDRASIFHMSVPYDMTFSWVPLFLTLWHWVWSFIYFLKTLTLPITF